MTPEEILNLSMDPEHNDAGAKTIREYLKALVMEVWCKQEGFSGKRPFGNSSWSLDMFEPLIKAGLITGSIDEDGCIEDCDERAGHQLIRSAIEAL